MSLLVPRFVSALELLPANTVYRIEAFAEGSSVLWQKYMCGNEWNHTKRYDHLKPNVACCISVNVLPVEAGVVKVQLALGGGHTKEFFYSGPYIIHE